MFSALSVLFLASVSSICTIETGRMEDRRCWFSRSLSSRGMYSEWLRAQVKVWIEQKPCCWSVISVCCLLCTVPLVALLMWKDGVSHRFLSFFSDLKNLYYLIRFLWLGRIGNDMYHCWGVDDWRCRLTCTFLDRERASFVCPRWWGTHCFPTHLSVRFRR
jgi:hypothetical protein